MNLLLINYEYPPVGGGAANATQSLGRALARSGHRVSVLTAGLRGRSGWEAEDGMDVLRLPTERIRADRASVGDMIAFLRQSWLRARRLQRERRFQGAIAFFTIPSGPAALRLRRKENLPYLISLCGGEVPGHVPGIDWMHTLTRTLRRSVLREATAIVANSRSLAAASEAADPFPVRFIPNGVDNDLYHPAPGVPERDPRLPLRLLFVGRVHPEKNLAAVVKQLAALPAGLRDRFELRVVGDGAERRSLEAAAIESGLKDRIRWLGWQGKAAMPAAYRDADVFVIPSLYEGMSNAVLEAMASGLPVLASDVPGNRALVEPGKTGVLFRLDRPEELGAALIRLEADRSWGSALGRAGRKRAEAEYSWTKTAQSYLELLPPVASASSLS